MAAQRALLAQRCAPDNLLRSAPASSVGWLTDHFLNRPRQARLSGGQARMPGGVAGVAGEYLTPLCRSAGLYCGIWFFSAAFFRSSLAMIATSTRRFCCLPLEVEFETRGWDSPYPLIVKRVVATPWLCVYWATD